MGICASTPLPLTDYRAEFRVNLDHTAQIDELCRKAPEHADMLRAQMRDRAACALATRGQLDQINDKDWTAFLTENEANKIVSKKVYLIGIGQRSLLFEAAIKIPNNRYREDIVDYTYTLKDKGVPREQAFERALRDVYRETVLADL